MRAVLTVISGIVMAFAALAGFVSLGDLGKTDSAGLVIGSAFGVVILAGILWMLTTISEQLSQLIVANREDRAAPVAVIVEPPLADPVPLPLGSKRPSSMWRAVITVGLVFAVLSAIFLLTMLHSQAH
jgi:hypothetical protein